MDTTKMDFVQVSRLSLISITILCISFTNSATVGRLEQVQLCNRLIDQSADNITGLKYAKECLILKYKYIQNPWLYFTERILRWAHFLRSSKTTQPTKIPMPFFEILGQNALRYIHIVFKKGVDNFEIAHKSC